MGDSGRAKARLLISGVLGGKLLHTVAGNGVGCFSRETETANPNGAGA
jgi:hypothetical protein